MILIIILALFSLGMIYWAVMATLGFINFELDQYNKRNKKK